MWNKSHFRILADFLVNTKTQVAGLVNMIAQFGFLYVLLDIYEHIFEWFWLTFGKKKVIYGPPLLLYGDISDKMSIFILMWRDNR